MRRYFVALFIIGFILQWTWEMAQMFAYKEMSGKPWQHTVRICTIATAGDLLATLLVYAIIALLIRRNFRWGLEARWRDYVWAALFGATIAVITEHVATAYNQWSYTAAMPIVPVLEVGLLPFLQLTLLVPLTIDLARWWYTLNRTK